MWRLLILLDQTRLGKMQEEVSDEQARSDLVWSQFDVVRDRLRLYWNHSPRASAGVRRFLPRADACPAHLALAGLARVPWPWSRALLTPTVAGHPRSDLD